jgi:hypothetical protein
MKLTRVFAQCSQQDGYPRERPLATWCPLAPVLSPPAIVFPTPRMDWGRGSPGRYRRPRFFSTAMLGRGRTSPRIAICFCGDERSWQTLHRTCTGPTMSSVGYVPGSRAGSSGSQRPRRPGGSDGAHVCARRVMAAAPAPPVPVPISPMVDQRAAALAGGALGEMSRLSHSRKTCRRRHRSHATWTARG